MSNEPAEHMMPHLKNKLVPYILYGLIGYSCLFITKTELAARDLFNNTSQMQDFTMQPITHAPAPDLPLAETEEDTNSAEPVAEPISTKKRINKIIFMGDPKLVSENALRAKIPFREGDFFDPVLTRTLISNINSLGYFNAIEVQIEDVSPTHIDLYIILGEKIKVEQIVYEGNAHLRKDEIEKKLKLSEIPAMDDVEIQEYADQIRSLYGEKSYHSAQVTGELRLTEQKTAIAVFKVVEGSPSTVRKICFEGNKTFTAKQLRSIIFTREDWIFGFLDKAGSFQPEMLEGDKFVIEDFYQSAGFLTARVADIKVDKDPHNPCVLNITYLIEEGDLYTVRSVSAVGNDIMSEPALLARIPIRPGQLYSRDLIRRSLELLRLIWGQFGYIYADIDPLIQPDHETKLVDITFISELGSQVYLDRINIIGNAKTRDYVIRRVLKLNEGGILRTPDMDESKANVEMLGFFEPRDGVNWKINKINENLASLDLMVKEVKTGKLFAQIGFGGADRDPTSPNSSAKVTAGVGDRNFLGTGISYNLALNYSREDRGLTFSIGNPWLFDRPITGAIEAYHRKSIYEDFRNLQHIPVEVITGTTGILGYAPTRFTNAKILFNAGLERIRFENDIRVVSDGKTDEQVALLQERLNRQFQPGTFAWVGGSIGQDLRNHPINPSRGYQWTVNVKAGLPAFHSNFGFVKMEADATWFTPLIGEYDLIFLLHGHGGFVHPLNGRNIPFRELFHLGGPATVRGFLWGQIGPSIFGDSLGGTKAFWVNAELIFNVRPDMKGVLFYDGGSSWDTPCVNPALLKDIRGNNFRFRHAIGFGIRLTAPTPLRVDWGFKLDRNRKRGEPISEVHFTMSQDF